MSETEIAAAVESATGKPSRRGLVNAWLRGDREPFMSQFFALCEKLEIDPQFVLQRKQHTRAEPLIQRRSIIQQSRKPYRMPRRSTG